MPASSWHFLCFRIIRRHRRKGVLGYLHREYRRNKHIGFVRYFCYIKRFVGIFNHRNREVVRAHSRKANTQC